MSAMYVWKTIRAAENNMAHDSPPHCSDFNLRILAFLSFSFFFLHSSDFLKVRILTSVSGF